jgi:hypothetical protein
MRRAAEIQIARFFDRLNSRVASHKHGTTWRRFSQKLGTRSINPAPTKVQTLLRRRGVDVPYRTLYRYCAGAFPSEIGGQREKVRVADGEPGHELLADFGRLGKVGLAAARRRVAKGLALTACVGRHQCRCAARPGRTRFTAPGWRWATPTEAAPSSSRCGSLALRDQPSNYPGRPRRLLAQPAPAPRRGTAGRNALPVDLNRRERSRGGLGRRGV